MCLCRCCVISLSLSSYCETRTRRRISDILRCLQVDLKVWFNLLRLEFFLFIFFSSLCTQLHTCFCGQTNSLSQQDTSQHQAVPLLMLEVCKAFFFCCFLEFFRFFFFREVLWYIRLFSISICVAFSKKPKMCRFVVICIAATQTFLRRSAPSFYTDV